MKSEQMNQLKDIFVTFFKIGLFTFGGGYAMIPLIEKEIVETKRWVGREDITDIFAVSQSIPGAIAINSATFIGYKIAGKKGTLAATLGIILPSIIKILLIASLLSGFRENELVKSIFAGSRPAVVGLIIIAVFKIGKTSIKDKTGFIISLIGFVVATVFDIHAIYVIIGGAVFGLTVYKLWPSKAKKIIGYGAGKKSDGIS